MDKELEEDTKRPPYFELVDKKAESNNTIDLDAYAKGVEDGVIWQAKRMFSEEEVRKLLQVQRGNCFVAILIKTKDHELASLATSAHEPSGKDGWVKNFNV